MPNTPNANQIAAGIAQRNVARFSQVPTKVSFEVDSKYVGDLENGQRMWVGSVFQVITPAKVYSNGAFEPQILTCQCTSVSAGRKADKWKVEGVSYKANIPPNADYYINSGEYLDYVLADELSFTEARQYIVIISQGAVFGSSSPLQAAFRQGTFPAGATLKLINQGQQIGMGGAGGDGASPTYDGGAMACFDLSGLAGGIGGPAMELTTDAVIDNSFGLIASGGNGGFGGNGACTGPFVYPGGGGGGGQGINGGGAGTAGTGNATAFNGSVGARNFGGTGGNGSGGGSQAGDTGGGLGGGNAIITNGNMITITAGNNSEQIRGAIV